MHKVRKTEVFLSSRHEDAKVIHLRESIFSMAKRKNLVVWRPPVLSEPVPGTQILDDCLNHLDQAKIYICFLVDSESTPQEDLGYLTILEMEMIYAVLSKELFYFFALKPFEPKAALKALVELLNRICPGMIQLCDSDREIVEKVRKIFWKYKYRYSLAIFLAPVRIWGMLRSCFVQPERLSAIWDEDSHGFLNGPLTSVAHADKLSTHQIASFLDRAAKEQNEMRKLVYLWIALRYLGLEEEKNDSADDASDIRRLRVRALSLWSKATAWAGLHGSHHFLGRLAVLKTIADSRQSSGLLPEEMETSHGALASELYSLAKLAYLAPKRRKQLLARAMTEVNTAIEQRQGEPSGLLLIRGSINIMMYRISEGTADYELAVLHREKEEGSLLRLGEAYAELGYGYLVSGKISEADSYLKKGVALMETADSQSEFTLRGIRKHAQFYLFTGHLIRAFKLFTQERKRSRAKGVRTFLKKMVIESGWLVSCMLRYRIQRIRNRQ